MALGPVQILVIGYGADAQFTGGRSMGCRSSPSTTSCA